MISLVAGVGLLMCEAAVAAKTGGHVSLSQKLWARAQQLAPLGQCAALPEIKIQMFEKTRQHDKVSKRLGRMDSPHIRVTLLHVLQMLQAPSRSVPPTNMSRQQGQEQLADHE